MFAEAAVAPRVARPGQCRRALPRALSAAAALLLALGPGPVSAQMPAAVDGQPLPSLAPMLDRVTPAVVNIATRGSELLRESPLLRDPFFRHFFGLPGRLRERPTQSQGSGVIIDAARGYILTNQHVIDGADEIGVTLRDGRQLLAVRVGGDVDTDVAVLQVPAEGLTAVRLADSDGLRVGDFVVAIGNPFGLGQTVTSGIVSALGRTGLGIEGYEDFIQTDASINVGNSGGALVNLRGELVGINTAILAPAGGNVGIGFAIPSNMALAIMTQLLEYGRVQRGHLGVVAQDVTPDLAELFGLVSASGAVVVEVTPDSAAAAAGLRPGDLLQTVNGRPVASSAQVRNMLGLLRVDERVRLGVLRGDRHEELQARLREAPPGPLSGAALHPNLAGAAFAEVPPDHPLAGHLEGVLVVHVEPRSPAAERGLRSGDIVTAVNRLRIQDVAGLQGAARGAGAVVLNLQRGESGVLVLLR